MASAKKVWREKLEKREESKIVDIPRPMQKSFGTGKMLIPKPLDVDALMRKAPKGKLIMQSQIRDFLAKESDVDMACPIRTGIIIRIAAETAEEDKQRGLRRITPYWRVIRDDGSLNPKYPGGLDAQIKRLEDEGHKIEASNKPCVKNFEKRLVKL